MKELLPVEATKYITFENKLVVEMKKAENHCLFEKVVMD
jgi:hypothetical protein